MPPTGLKTAKGEVPRADADGDRSEASVDGEAEAAGDGKAEAAGDGKAEAKTGAGAQGEAEAAGEARSSARQLTGVKRGARRDAGNEVGRETEDEASEKRDFLSTLLWRIAPALILIGASAYVLSPYSAAFVAVLIVGLFIVYRVTPKSALRPRRTLAYGSATLLLGLALIGTGSADAGSGITLLALILMMFGIHTFGRLGPDEASSRR